MGLHIPLHGIPIKSSGVAHRKTLTCYRCKSSPSTKRSMASMPTLIEDVVHIPSKYKGILLDQFGVLHDGKRAYPTAIQAVKKLSESGRKIVILSNSSRKCFAGAITSGETTFACLRDRPDSSWTSLGNKCLHITWGRRGTVPVAGMGIEVVPTVDAADFVLAHGTEALGQGDDKPPEDISMEEIKALLQQAAAKGLPLIVANPDVLTVSGNTLVPMPGTFARWYKEMDGEVRLMGKPDPIVYVSAMELIGLAPDQVLAVGDSLEHDIYGANAAGIDSLFIAGGIHAEELSITESQLTPNQDKLQELINEHKAEPRLCMPFLR